MTMPHINVLCLYVSISVSGIHKDLDSLLYFPNAMNRIIQVFYLNGCRVLHVTLYDHNQTFLYVKAPTLRERLGRPHRGKKIGRPIAIRWLRMKGNLAISEY